MRINNQEVKGNESELAGFRIAGQEVITYAEKIAANACRSFGPRATELAEDVTSHLLEVIFRRSDLLDKPDGTIHRTAGKILSGEAKEFLSGFTNISRNPMLGTDLEIAKTLKTENPPGYVTQALWGIKPEARETLLAKYRDGKPFSSAAERKKLQRAREALGDRANWNDLANARATGQKYVEPKIEDEYFIPEFRGVYKKMRKADIISDLLGRRIPNDPQSIRLADTYLASWGITYPLYIWANGGEVSDRMREAIDSLSLDDQTLLRIRFSNGVDGQEKRFVHDLSLGAMERLEKTVDGCSVSELL